MDSIYSDLKSQPGAEFISSFMSVQKRIKHIKETGYNKHFTSKHATLDYAIEKIYPILNDNSFVLMQPLGFKSVRTLLIHTSGQMLESEISLPYNGEDPQKLASCITYLRRYALLAILGIAPSDEDDDGHHASSNFKEPELKPAPGKPLKDTTIAAMGKVMNDIMRPDSSMHMKPNALPSRAPGKTPGPPKGFPIETERDKAVKELQHNVRVKKKATWEDVEKLAESYGVVGLHKLSYDQIKAINEKIEAGTYVKD